MADLPGIPEQAIAPIDYSGYGRTAQAMTAAGAGIEKVFSDFANFEHAQNKEELRIEALRNLYEENPELRSVARTDMDVNELGKGISQLNMGMFLYDKAQKAGVPVPDKTQFKQGVFMASPDAFEHFRTNYEKIIQDAEKEKGSSEQIQIAQRKKAELELEHPERKVTREELLSKAQYVPAKAEAVGMGAIEKMAPSETELARMEMAKARFSLDQNKARIYADKVGSDKFYSDLNKTQSTLSAYERALKDKDAAQLKVNNLLTNKDNQKTLIEMKGGTFNENQYDEAIKSAQKIVNDREGILKGILRNAKSGTREFNKRYPGALQFEPDIEAELGGISDVGGGIEQTIPQPKTPEAVPGGAEWQIITLPGGQQVKVRKKTSEQ